MSDLTDLLERADRAVADVPFRRRDGIEAVRKRRDRRRRNQRFAAALVAVVIAIAALGSAAAVFRKSESRVPRTQGQTSAPTPRVQVQETVIAGIPGTVCDPSSVNADFGLGSAATDTAYVYGVPTTAGGCPESGPRTAFIGIAPDTGRDSASEVTITSDPIDCGDSGCRVFAAPDIDGDGIAELSVVTQKQGAEMSLGLYRLACPPATACTAGNQAAIAQYAFRKTGSADQPAVIEWGGVAAKNPPELRFVLQPTTGDHIAGAWCATDGNGGRVLHIWAGTYLHTGALYDTYRVHEETYSAHGTVLELIRTDEHELATPKLPPMGDFCGAPTTY